MAHLSSLVVAILLAVCAAAQAPAGYYSSVDPSSAAALRSTLHAVIDDHVEFAYTSSATDTWDILERAQQDPANPARIIDLYRNGSFAKINGRVSDYNREHTWPRSYGFAEGRDYGPFTDCHALYLSDPGYNTARSNYPFGNCGGCAEYPTLSTNGAGGGSGVYPGESNWLQTSFGSRAYGSWQVWGERRGDVARALLYLDVRYEGGIHNGTGRFEPDLVLTDDRSLIAASQNSSNNLSTAYMGLLSVLLQWHLEDPPDAVELARNDAVYRDQRNRNPFADHPEWVAIIWGLTVPVTGSVTSFGVGCGGQFSAAPTIAVNTTPTLGQNLIVSVSGAPPFAAAALQLDFATTSIDLGLIGYAGCRLYVVPVVSTMAQTSLFGVTQISIPIPNRPALVGEHLFGQWLVANPQEASIVATGGVDMLFGN